VILYVPRQEAYDYLKGLFTGTTNKYEGHNQAGGSKRLISRKKDHDEYEDKNERKHSAYEDDEAEKFWQKIHEFFVGCCPA